MAVLDGAYLLIAGPDTLYSYDVAAREFRRAGSRHRHQGMGAKASRGLRDHAGAGTLWRSTMAPAASRLPGYRHRRGPGTRGRRPRAHRLHGLVGRRRVRLLVESVRCRGGPAVATRRHHRGAARFRNLVVDGTAWARSRPGRACAGGVPPSRDWEQRTATRLATGRLERVPDF